MQQKRCSRCGKVKFSQEFNKHKRSKDGLQNLCRVCQNETKKIARVNVTETVRTKECLSCGQLFKYLSRKKVFCSNNCRSVYNAKNKTRLDWEENNRSKKMLYRVKHRAKRLGIPFDIEECDIDIPETCPVLGIKIEVARGKGYSDSSPSLDRIIPSKGYVKNNVRVISNRANLLKNNATVEELEMVLDDLKKLRETTILREFA